MSMFENCHHLLPLTAAISQRLTGPLGVTPPVLALLVHVPVLNPRLALFPFFFPPVRAVVLAHISDRMSKTALNQFTKCFSIESKRDNCFPVRKPKRQPAT